MDKVRRSVLNVQVVVETTGDEEAHERSVIWAAQRLKSAHMYVKSGAGVALRVSGPDGRDLGFAGHGDVSAESREIIDDFFDVPQTEAT